MTTFRVGDLVRITGEDDQPFAVVVMEVDPQENSQVAVRWSEGYDYRCFDYLVTPDNPDGRDYHTYVPGDLELVENLEEAEVEALKSILESARRKADG